MIDFAASELVEMNDEWITGEEVSDPTPLPSVKGWRLLVRPLPVKRKTESGILLPDQYMEDAEYLNTVGRVLAIGDQAYKHSSFEDKAWCAVGDYIIWPKHVGRRFVYKGVKLMILEDKNVLMTVPDPQWLDPLAKPK